MPSRRTYRWCLNNGDGLNNFLLVHLRTWSIQITHDRSHTGLVPHSRRKVNGFLWVILGEGLDLSSVTACPLPRQEGQGAVSGGLELAVRLRLNKSATSPANIRHIRTIVVFETLEG